MKTKKLCLMQRHIGEGGAVDNARVYVVKLDTLSTTSSITAHKLHGDSMQTALYSLHID